MKYLPMIAILALAACESGQRRPTNTPGPRPPTAEQRKVQAEVEDTWNAFKESMIAGDADAGFLMISNSFRAEWLYGMMKERDSLFRDWSEALPASARTDLDLWYNFSKKHRRTLQRAEQLPRTVLGHPSLLKLWGDYFKIDRLAMKIKMQGSKVEKVAVDGTGATVQVRSGTGRMEFYNMIPEGAGWKIDGFSPGSPY